METTGRAPHSRRLIDGIKRTLQVMGSTMALIIVGFAVYFLATCPNLISFIGFFVVVPTFLIIGLGLFSIARRGATD